MATASSLTDAAAQAYALVYAKWSTATLASALASYSSGVLALLPDDDTASRPVTNWMILIASLAVQVPTGGVFEPGQLEALENSSSTVYRSCLMGTVVLTAPQQAAMLAVFNASF